MSRILIIPTGSANLASVTSALDRLGAESRIATALSDGQNVDGVVLPGVGTFAAARKTLTDHEWDRFLIDRIQRDLPTLAICVGFQLLFESSDESPGIDGLGILPGRLTRFPADVSVPQFGWNRVASESPWFETGFVYYANSFKLDRAPDDCEAAVSKHGDPFVAGIRRGRLLGCQFHPELSGLYGQNFLARWLKLCHTPS